MVMEVLSVAGGDGSTRAVHWMERSMPSEPLMTSQARGPMLGADWARIPERLVR